MQKRQLGKTDLLVSRICFGCWQLSPRFWSDIPLDPWKQALHKALDVGVNFIDTADAYGEGYAESSLGDFLAKENLRDRFVIATKFYWNFEGDARFPDTRYAYILRECEASLKRLKTDRIDLYQIHAFDPLTRPDEVGAALNRLKQEGKVRWFGVSNHTAAQIRLLQTCVAQPIVTNQVQLSVVHSRLFNDGIMFNRDEIGPITRSEGLVEFSRMENITLQAWGPLAAGLVTGRLPDQPPPHLATTAGVVADIAKEKGVSKEAILVAWILRHPANIQVIIGTTKPERIAGSCEAGDLELTREEWYRLFTAGRGERVP